MNNKSQQITGIQRSMFAIKGLRKKNEKLIDRVGKK